MDLPSRTEEIVVCSALLLEALFIVSGNLVTRAEKLVSGYKHGVRGCNVRSCIRSFVCLFKGRFSAMEYHTRGWGSVGPLLPSLRYHFLARFVNFRSFYILWKILRRRLSATKTPSIVISVIWTLAIVASAMYFILANLISVIAAYYLSAILFSIFLFIIYVCNFCIWRKCKMRTISSRQQNRTAQNQHLTRTLLFVSASLLLLFWRDFLM